MKGKFVTIEGCEGVGKSTQLRFLKEYFAKNGIDAVFTREPGGTPVSEAVRSVILNPEFSEMDDVTELLLYAAARRQHTQEFIARRLGEGRTVICDRYIDSTMAYQGYARGVDKDMIGTLNRWAMGDVIIDLTLFLDVDPVEGFRRKGGADKTDRLEREEPDFHRRVYEGYRAIAAAEPRVVSVKAEGTKFETHDKIIAVLKEKGVIR